MNWYCRLKKVAKQCINCKRKDHRDRMVEPFVRSLPYGTTKKPKKDDQ